jgi:hypothetical protein
MRTRVPKAFQIGHLVTLLERLAFFFIGHDDSEKATTSNDLQPFSAKLLRYFRAS